MRRLLRIATWVGLGLLGLIVLLAGWVGIRFLVDPVGTRQGLDMLYVVATSNHYPPPIAATGVVQDGDRWMMPEPAGSKFTAILRKTFPLGSSASAMQAALVQEGFQDDVAQACENPPDPGTGTCRSRVVPDSVRYDWGGLPCDQTLRVTWKADGQDRLTEIAGWYDAVCL